jgi:hypothetical protein
MKGLVSVNTSAQDNPFCREMHKDCNKVCSSCYSDKFERIRKVMKECFMRNGVTLSTTKVKPFTINHTIVRFDSFGELINRLHAINLFALARFNPNTQFTLWTKRPNLLVGLKKPANVIIIYSSPYKNVCAKNILDKYSFIDKVFTVYNLKYIRENDIQINCGKKICIECKTCYSKNNITFVNEQIK